MKTWLTSGRHREPGDDQFETVPVLRSDTQEPIAVACYALCALRFPAPSSAERRVLGVGQAGAASLAPR